MSPIRIDWPQVRENYSHPGTIVDLLADPAEVKAYRQEIQERFDRMFSLDGGNANGAIDPTGPLTRDRLLLDTELPKLKQLARHIAARQFPCEQSPHDPEEWERLREEVINEWSQTPAEQNGQGWDDEDLEAEVRSRTANAQSMRAWEQDFEAAWTQALPHGYRDLPALSREDIAKSELLVQVPGPKGGAGRDRYGNAVAYLPDGFVDAIGNATNGAASMGGGNAETPEESMGRIDPADAAELAQALEDGGVASTREALGLDRPGEHEGGQGLLGKREARRPSQTPESNGGKSGPGPAP